jgi:hypothetical protein
MYTNDLLPRPARDKHWENSKNDYRFLLEYLVVAPIIPTSGGWALLGEL